MTTIDEYKQAFSDLFKQLQEEHGAATSVIIGNRTTTLYTVPHKQTEIVVEITF